MIIMKRNTLFLIFVLLICREDSTTSTSLDGHLLNNEETQSFLWRWSLFPWRWWHQPPHHHQPPPKHHQNPPTPSHRPRPPPQHHSPSPSQSPSRPPPSPSQPVPRLRPPPGHPKPPHPPPLHSLPPPSNPVVRNKPAPEIAPRDCSTALIFVDGCISDLITSFFGDKVSISKACCQTISGLSDRCFIEAFTQFEAPSFIGKVRGFCASSKH